jgi:hypothetical protein
VAWLLSSGEPPLAIGIVLWNHQSTSRHGLSHF